MDEFDKDNQLKHCSCAIAAFVQRSLRVQGSASVRVCTARVKPLHEKQTVHS